MATHSSILAWEIPWTKDPGGLQSTELESWTWVGSEPSCKLLWDAAGPKSSKLLLPSAVSVPDKAHHLFHLSFNFKNGAKKKIHIAIPRPITKKMKRY